MIPNNEGKIEKQNNVSSPPKNLFDLQIQENFNKTATN